MDSVSLLSMATSIQVLAKNDKQENNVHYMYN